MFARRPRIPLMRPASATLVLPFAVFLSSYAAGQAAPAYDVIIRHARVLDGSGNPWIEADMAIQGPRLVAVGAIPAHATAARVIDAAGLTAAPGFIDVHS